MSFVSFEFIGICVLTALLYFILPKQHRWYAILAASVYFYYSSAGLVPIIIAIITIIITYCSGIWIDGTGDDKDKRKLLLTIAVIVISAILVFFKIKKYISWDISFLIVPLGVSYYSFSLIGYIVDVYYRKCTPEKNILKFILYSLYFPKIVQGPISKFRDIGPKLIEGHAFDYDRMCFGLQRMLWGYFKKVMIADRAAILTSIVFDDFSEYNLGGLFLLLSTFLAVVRFYCDFSGYMDIAIGYSQILGIELDENFKQPFFSKSAAEFWRRWHITLGLWFKDYVYMPMVSSPVVMKISTYCRNKFGKRAGKAMYTVIPLAVVWLLTGLWHGTGIDYIIWGVYWGTIIIVSNVYAAEIKKLVAKLHINAKSTTWQLFQMVRTSLIFTGGLLISTYVGFTGLPHYFRCLFSARSMDVSLLDSFKGTGLGEADALILPVSILILFIVDILAQKKSVRERMTKLNCVLRWLIWAAMFVVIIVWGVYGAGYSTSGFMYANY